MLRQNDGNCCVFNSESDSGLLANRALSLLTSNNTCGTTETTKKHEFQTLK